MGIENSADLEAESPDFLGDNIWCDVFFRKYSLFKLALEHPDDLVNNLFDGGETVYRKVRR